MTAEERGEGCEGATTVRSSDQTSVSILAERGEAYHAVSILFNSASLL